MTRLFLDATTVISLGSVGELALVTNFSGEPVVLPAVRSEVTTEPARTNLDHLLETGAITATTRDFDRQIARARDLLGASTRNGDVEIIAAVLAAVEAEKRVGVVSDDRRVRTTADTLGAAVTGTIGVLVRSVAEGLPAAAGLEILERIDSRGLHLTGELRARAESLIREAAAEE